MSKETLKKTGLLILLITICFGSVWIFTRNAIWPSWSLSSTGQIGDTIGGITGPILNFIAAILIYLTFKEQIKANKIQKEALENEVKTNRRMVNKENIYTRYKECKQIVLEFEYNGDKGYEALDNSIKDGKLLTKPKYFDPFLTVLYMINGIHSDIENSKLFDSDRKFLKDNLKYLYRSRVEKPFRKVLFAINITDQQTKVC